LIILFKFRFRLCRIFICWIHLSLPFRCKHRIKCSWLFSWGYHFLKFKMHRYFLACRKNGMPGLIKKFEILQLRAECESRFRLGFIRPARDRASVSLDGQLSATVSPWNLQEIWWLRCLGGFETGRRSERNNTFHGSGICNCVHEKSCRKRSREEVNGNASFSSAVLRDDAALWLCGLGKCKQPILKKPNCKNLSLYCAPFFCI
jgi:hypothetical protein